MRRASDPIIDSEFAEKPSPPNRVAVIVSGLLQLFSILGLFGCFLLPMLVRSALCPEGTFLSGSTSGDGVVLSALIIGPGFMALGWCVSPSAPTGWAPQFAYMAGVQDWIQNHRVFSATLASVGLVAAAVVWTNWAFAYYCATPQGILLHPSAFGGYRQFVWSDVKAANVECWQGTKGSQHGGLVLRFSDNENVRLDPTEFSFRNYYSPRLRQKYLTIRQALAGHRFHFAILDAKDCPPHVRTYWFVWPHAGA